MLVWCSFFLMDCSLENYYFLSFLKVLEPQTTHNSSWGPKSTHGYLIMLGKHSFTKYYSLFMDGLTNACWMSGGIGKCLLLHNWTLIVGEMQKVFICIPRASSFSTLPLHQLSAACFPYFKNLKCWHLESLDTRSEFLVNPWKYPLSKHRIVVSGHQESDKTIS